MNAIYIINIRINNVQVPTLINANENYSIITTGLLEKLDIKCNNVKFIQKQLEISKQTVQTIGQIGKFEMIFEFFYLHHDVYIINDETPLLLLGKDWTRKYNVIYGTAYMHLNYQQQKLRIPIMQIDKNTKQDPMELDEVNEKESKGNTILPISRNDTQIPKQDFNEISQMPPGIIQKSTKEKAIRRLKNTSLQWKDKKKKQSNKESPPKETINQCKCYLCKQKGHTMKGCKLEPLFRKHEQTCKENGTHKWKSWKPPDELQLSSNRV
jgi:hypothetical protein